MSKLINIPFIIALLTIGSWINGKAQDSLPQCIIFERGSDFVNIQITEDSTRASFSIIKKGFETEEKREKAWEEYYQGPPVEERYPIFSIDFSSYSKPEKVKSIEELSCISLKEFRETGGRGAGSVRFFFQKNPDGTFLMWDNILLWGYE